MRTSHRSLAMTWGVGAPPAGVRVRGGLVICKQTFRKPAAGAAGGHRAGGAKIFWRFFVPKAEKSCKTGPFQLPSSSAAPTRAAPAEHTRQRHNARAAHSVNAAGASSTLSAEIQRSLASPELPAAIFCARPPERVHASAAVAPGSDRDERPHAGQLQTSSAQATAHEQDQHAASKHKNGRGARRRLLT